MRNYLPLIVFIFISTIAIALGWGITRPDAIPQSEPRLLSRHDYERIAELIEHLPPWSNEISAVEWTRVAQLASALQFLEPRDVEIALLLFMSRNTKVSDHPIQGNATWTKPLLLLAIMFDKTKPESDLRHIRSVLEQYAILPCGGRPWKRIVESKTEHGTSQIPESDPLLRDSLQLPIRWNADGPELMAIPGSVQAGNLPQAVYEPHIEFQAFRQIYPYRTNFRPLLEGRIGSWKLLWRQWIYHPADPDMQKKLRYKYRDVR